MSKLDHQRLVKRIGQSKSDNSLSRSQLISLSRRVQEATLLDPADIPANVVTMNSQVSLSYVDSPKTLTLQLVYPEQANAAQNRISILAPIATALLGRREKEIIDLLTPYGTVKIRVDRILYQPEAAGDFFL